MSALQLMATTLWTQLLQAMQADGLIATCITQSGPATTKVIVDACTATLPAPWLGPHIRPQPGKEVVAMATDTRVLKIVSYNGASDAYCWDDCGTGGILTDDAILAYTFVNTQGAPQ